MRNLDVVVAILLVIGGLNWGMVGLLDFDLGSYLFSGYPVVQNTVYILVGLSAVYQVVSLKAIQARWNVK